MIALTKKIVKGFVQIALRVVLDQTDGIRMSISSLPNRPEGITRGKP